MRINNNFAKKSARMALAIVAVIAVTVWSFGPVVLITPKAQATVTPTVTSLINFGNNKIKATSDPKAAIKLVIVVDLGEQLVALSVAATDNASSGFNPATDLAALSSTAEATSGIALYNDAGATAGSFDGTDAVVDLSAISAWSSNATTMTLTAPAAAGTFYLVYRTAAAAVNNHAFVLTIPTNGIATTISSTILSAPVSTNPITIDTTAPTLNASTTGPANNSTGVPISASIHVGFSENLDQSTVNPTNVTFCSVAACGSPGAVAVASGIRTFPDGFDVNVSSPPTFAASSRFSKVAGTSTAFYNIMGGQTIAPQPPSGYSVPSVSDIVITQRETFPPEVGVVTDATMTGGAFAINGFSAFGGQQITKFGTFGGGASSPVNLTTTSIGTGEVVVAYTAANPTGVKYDWHMVTTGALGAAHADLRLDGASAAPTYGTHPGGGVSRYTGRIPTDTSAVNVSNAVEGNVNGGIDFVVGDMVFAKITANGDNLNNYAWHIVTAAENIITVSAGTTLRFDGASALPAFAVSSQVSKFAFGAQDAVSGTTALSFGDLVLAKTTANASNNNSYALHIVNGADAVNGTALRFDNFPGSLTPSTTYVVTATTGVKDTAGNALAPNQTVTFTTGATGGTNTTPPFVQSTQPNGGSQNHPINAPIRLTFSVDMAASGGGSIIADANIGLFTDNFGAPGTPVTTTKAYDSASRTVTLTPSASLIASTGYVVRVNTTATSATGTAFMQPYFLSFRTPSGLADSTAPTVLGASPANSSTGVSLGAVITAGFSEDMDPSTIISPRIKLALTSNLAATVAGTVTYNPSSRSASFAPSTALTANTSYTFTIVSGASGVKDLSSNQLAADFTAAFTTTATADTTKPSVTFSNADNFSVAITFNESVKTGGGPNAVDNITNYTLETGAAGATFATVGLGGKTVAYEAGTKTARITGLSLVNGNQYKITVAVNAQDLTGNAMDDTGTPAKNISFGIVQNSTTTGGQIGPGSGTIDPGMQGMNPSRVMPMNRAAGGTSSYHVEFLAGTSVPSLGQVVLSFPAGFTLTSAAAVSTVNSFCNADLNGPATGAPTIGGSVVADNDAGTVTINTATAATGANAFLCMDISGIVNSTVPSSSGYTVTIQTKDTADNNRATLQTITAAPFFLGQTGSRTLTVNVFKDASPFNGTNDDGEGINGVTVFLFSPATGGQEATTATSVIAGKATFSNLADGDYMIGIKPNANINVAFNSAPQPFTVSASNLIKNFALSNAAALTIGGTITGTNGTKVDVFASSPNGFTKKTMTLTGGADAYSLPVSANATYNVGVGPSIPESFFTPGAPPPPPPDFTFMPPANLQVQVVTSNITGKNFTLSTASKTITGTVVDSSGTTGVSGAGVFCRPVASSTTGTASGFGTGTQTSTTGAFTVKVNEGVYLCGVFKPGMPPVADRQITVGASANTPSTLTFTLDAGTTSLTISGTVKDDAGNAISYAGVSGRKVVSSSDTTAVGGDSSNFIGGPTDANGAYTLYVSAGTWVVEAFAPGFGRLGTKTIVVTTSNATGQDFSAQTLSLGTISGTTTRDSVAVQGAMVRAETANGASGNMAITAANGTYSMKVPVGTYTVKCFFPGLGEGTPLTNVAVTLNTTTSGQDCALAAPITITVNVTSGAIAITNAGVDVRDANGRGNFTNVSTTLGANAVYVVSVPPGTYTVRVGHPAYGKIGQTTAVSTTQEITYTATAGATFAVTGTVTGNGSNLSGAWVSLIGTPTGSTNIISLGGQTIANGTFSISVPAGSYRLRVDKPGYRSPAESTVAVTAATAAGTIALTTAAKTITGTISISGSGISNAFVDATDGLGGYAVAQTDAVGAYSLAVDTGTWSLRAHAPGYEGGPLPVVVGGSNVSGQNLALTAISGFTVKPEKPETVTPTSGGFLTNSDIGANFKMNIPANALGTSSNAATVTTKINTGMPNPPSGAILSKNAITITAVDSSGQKVSSLNDSVTITVPYDEANLPAGAVEANLVIGTWNDATQTYDTLTTTVDTTNNTLTATVTHFSDFAPLIPSSESAPSAPTNLGVSNPRTGNSLTLSWTASSGAATYNIYKSTDNSSFPLLASTSSTSYTASSLTENTQYYFKVSAVSATSAESAATTAVSGIPIISAGGGGGGGSLTTTPVTTAPSTTTGAVTATPTSGGDTTYTPSDAASPQVKVTLPVNAVTASTNVTVASTTLSSSGITVSPTTAGVTSVIGTPFNFTAVAGSTAVTTFSQPVTLTFTYTDSQLPNGAKESDLIVMYYNSATSKWETVSSTVDAANNKVTATTNHFTVFILALKPASVTAPGETPVVASSRAHANGTLVNDNGTIYLIRNGKRVGFRNVKEYTSHGYNFKHAVVASDADKALVMETEVAKAMTGTLVLDAADNKTVYMIGVGSTKRGFVSSAVFKALGYSFANLPKINLSDYPTGAPIGDSTAAHPDGSLVFQGKTIWWLRSGQKVGFESMVVFNTYGFSIARVLKGNAADFALPEGSVIKLRDGTLVLDGSTYYLVSDGKKLAFTSMTQLTSLGYKTANAVKTSLSAYESAGSVQ